MKNKRTIIKKIAAGFLVFGICTAVRLADGYMVSNTVYAEENQTQSITLKTDGSESKYNIKWNDKFDRLLIDSNFVSDYFGAAVEIYDDSVDIHKNNHILHFENGNDFYIMDNLGGRKIDCLAETDGQSAFVPLRCIVEAFGASVSYDSSLECVNIISGTVNMDESIKPYFENVQVFDQSTIRICGEKTIYADPRRILGSPHDADIIFITHPHNDHYEIDSIKRIMKPSTVIYITEDGVEQAKADGLINVIGVKPNEDYDENGIKFSTVASYNTSSERQNHKKEYNWVGYVITVNGYTYYTAGDSDFIEEMKNIGKPIDVAFLPIDGKYNMAADEAARAANAIKPKVAVPYHYNNFVDEDKAVDFVSMLDDNIKGAIVTFKMNN